MSIYKRGAVWWIRFTTPDGREVRETARTADRKQAQEYHDLCKAECWRIAKLGERPCYTWQQAVVRWLEEHADRKGLDSVLAYLRQAHITLGDLSLSDTAPAPAAATVGKR